jgi:hypothetical protein
MDLSYIYERGCVAAFLYLSWSVVYADKLQSWLAPDWTLFHGHRGLLNIRLVGAGSMVLLVLIGAGYGVSWFFPIALTVLWAVIRILQRGLVRSFGLNVWDRDGE